MKGLTNPSAAHWCSGCLGGNSSLQGVLHFTGDMTACYNTWPGSVMFPWVLCSHQLPFRFNLFNVGSWRCGVDSESIFKDFNKNLLLDHWKIGVKRMPGKLIWPLCPSVTGALVSSCHHARCQAPSPTFIFVSVYLYRVGVEYIRKQLKGIKKSCDGNK